MLDKIQKSKLNIDRKQEKENNEILKIFLEALITKMKEQDPLFNELYQKIFFTGSYYEGLRVSNPSEFDMNLVLKFPIKSEDREIETGNNVNPPSFARFRLKIPYEKVMSKHPHPEKYQGMEKFFDGKNYLCPMKVRSWIQSVVDRANKSGFWSFSKVTVSRHGPAETMYVCIGKDEQIEIDLVPSLEFKTPEWPSGMEKLFPEGNCQQVCFMPEQSWF
ncbi:cyclic GMP-AMP synthase-like receptor isoform X2 [Tachypleus tridentatus]|uniref:cyclic GMP-AMP synthase-like receptor isoform X2 n=1 Tax=Tachypleus tridentatus TaxID=6853 RepID=UPI003FD154C7